MRGFFNMLKKEVQKMEYALAIGYIEEVILKLKAENKKITIEELENSLDKLLDKNKEIIIAYAKVALDNINHSANEVTAREMEAQIQILKDLYTTEKLIERAKKL